MRSFSDVAIDDPNEDAAAIEAAEFWMKVDSEGGLVGYLQWGGSDRFPEGLRPVAWDLEHLLSEMEHAAVAWSVERGVTY